MSRPTEERVLDALRRIALVSVLVMAAALVGLVLLVAEVVR